MTAGNFIYFAHQHLFEATKEGTVMKDILTYKPPYGIFGTIFDKLALKKHLTSFLKKRNQELKYSLENTSYKAFI